MLACNTCVAFYFDCNQNFLAHLFVGRLLSRLNSLKTFHFTHKHPPHIFIAYCIYHGHKYKILFSYCIVKQLNCRHDIKIMD